MKTDKHVDMQAGMCIFPNTCRHTGRQAEHIDREIGREADRERNGQRDR